MCLRRLGRRARGELGMRAFGDSCFGESHGIRRRFNRPADCYEPAYALHETASDQFEMNLKNESAAISSAARANMLKMSHRIIFASNL